MVPKEANSGVLTPEFNAFAIFDKSDIIVCFTLNFKNHFTHLGIKGVKTQVKTAPIILVVFSREENRVIFAGK